MKNFKKLKFNLKLVFINCFLLNLLVVNKTNCDLSLFTSDDLHNTNYDNIYNSDEFDRLHLFPSTKDCPNQVNIDDLDKNVICKDFCLSYKQNEAATNENETSTENYFKTYFSNQRTTEAPLNQAQSQTHVEFNSLNLTGALGYYRNFVHTFLNHIKQQDSLDETFEYKIGVELNKHQILKLETFSQSLKDSDAVDSIQDITDILKEMFVKIELNKTPSLKDKFLDTFSRIELIDSIMIKYVFIVLISVITFALVFAYIRRFGIHITWFKIFGILVFVLFVMSVINNHMYLTQKKQILNQQKLKEFVPEECLIKNEQKPQSKEFFSKFKVFIKNSFGYTATSKRCLEYQEALFIQTSQNNYIETVVYTISEGVRPVAVLFGEFINNFYSALTKDLSFYQYMPLIGLVTTVFVPLGLIILCFVCLLLFGYDFNFLHLVSLKKSKQAPVESLECKKEDILKILNMLKDETKKLPISMTNSTNSIQSIEPGTNNNDVIDLVPIEGQDPNETLTKNIEKIFEKINNKETKLKKQIELLKSENENLKETITKEKKIKVEENLEEVKEISKNQNVRNESQEEIESNRSLEVECQVKNPSSELCREIIKTSKEISIGLSKTVKNSSKLNQLRSSSRHKNCQNNDDDDDEEDIYVILDEN